MSVLTRRAGVVNRWLLPSTDTEPQSVGFYRWAFTANLTSPERHAAHRLAVRCTMPTFNCKI